LADAEATAPKRMATVEKRIVICGRERKDRLLKTKKVEDSRKSWRKSKRTSRVFIQMWRVGFQGLSIMVPDHGYGESQNHTRSPAPAPVRVARRFSCIRQYLSL